MSTWAIGDIQGCYAELRLLLDQCCFDPAADTLWLTGDLVNRGPQNLETLDYVMSLGDRARCVLGNHDLHFLAIASGRHRAHRGDTIEDVLAADHVDTIVDWLRRLPLVIHDPHFELTMVHAGLPPIWDIAACLERAREVETVLAGPDYQEFLGEMYGNKPANWSPVLAGHDRLRLITNYFTRLRYCTGDGELELKHKTDVAPDGYAPWFSFPRSDTRVVFGHWAALEGVTGKDWAIALDTGCVWGRSLTAVCLEDGRRLSQPALEA